MASSFCCCVERLFFDGQLIFATVAIQAARNSRGTSGKLSLASGFGTIVFDGVGLVVSVDFFVSFATGCLVAQEVMKRERKSNNMVDAFAKEYFINKF